eukprot:RCo015043
MSAVQDSRCATAVGLLLWMFLDFTVAVVPTTISGYTTNPNPAVTGIPVSLNFIGTGLLTGPGKDGAKVVTDSSCTGSTVALGTQVITTLSGSGSSSSSVVFTFLQGGTFLVCYLLSGASTYVQLNPVVVEGPSI